MSHELVKQIGNFIHHRTDVATFVDQYIASWRTERDDESLLADDDNVSEFLSSAFCIVDLYNPSESRQEYEFDENRLRAEILKLAHDLAIIL